MRETMTGKMHFTSLIVVLLGASLLLSSQAPAGAAEATKKGSAAKAVVPAPVKPPEIRRTAVIQNREGERILASPLAMARDESNGDLLVVNFEAGEVAILDRNGVLIKRLGRDAELQAPYGVAVGGKGEIYVSEVRTGLLKVLSPAGAPVDEFDLNRIAGRKVAPGRITLGGDGLIYVVDLLGNEILIVNGKGELVRALGRCDYLQKAGVVNGDRILALSGQGKAVNLFTREGAPLLSFGQHGDESDKNVSFPTGFALDAKGRLWIADAFQHRLKVFSLDGKFLFNFGRMEEKVGDGGFLFPVDLFFGKKGELFVLEKGADRVQIFQVGDLKE